MGAICNVYHLPIKLFKPAMEDIIVEPHKSYEWDGPDYVVSCGEHLWQFGDAVKLPGHWLYNGTSYLIHGGVASPRDLLHESIAS